MDIRHQEQVLQERRADIPFDRLQLIVVAWILLAGAVGFTLLFSLSALEGLWLEGVVDEIGSLRPPGATANQA